MKVGIDAKRLETFLPMLADIVKHTDHRGFITQADMRDALIHVASDERHIAQFIKHMQTEVIMNDQITKNFTTVATAANYLGYSFRCMLAHGRIKAAEDVKREEPTNIKVWKDFFDSMVIAEKKSGTNEEAAFEIIQATSDARFAPRRNRCR